MSTSLSFFEYVREQTAAISGVSFKRMMGEYLLYFDGVLVGGLYDDRFVLKDTPSLKNDFSGFLRVFPYDGSKTEMVVMDDLEDVSRLADLIVRVYQDIKSGETCKRR